MGPKPIVVVGSLNFDLIAHVQRLVAPGETLTGLGFQSLPGGKGANQAAAIARLGHSAYMMGRVGSDAFGVELRDSLERAGADATFVATSKGSSGVAMIVVSAEGENSIVVVPGANALLLPEDLDVNLELIRSAGIVLTQLEIPLDTVDHLAELCANEGVPLILDPAPVQQLSCDLMSRLSWITPNEIEAQQLSGLGPADTEEEIENLAGALLALGPKNVLLKRGERGAFMATEEGLRGWIPAYPVHAVDTTGAGDAFNGAFAVALARGASPFEAAKFASAAAAISVTRHGALPSMATQAEVDAFLYEGPQAGEEMARTGKSNCE
ncbi:MAG TPA: ribokinase [Terracidiphilus sp.]|jgi:ribokinase